MKRDIQFSGVLLQYFLIKDHNLDLVYVIGIREYEPYPLQLIRTVPVVSIDEHSGMLKTLFCSYLLGIRITDVNEQQMYLRVFERRFIEILDNETIGTTLVLTLQ
ncbi:MAG: hypothetical protein NWQ54_15875 [Paraglaciecola sp.]|nr:hypothetical protein [Paraglaciecola sp.]